MSSSWLRKKLNEAAAVGGRVRSGGGGKQHIKKEM
jgi:hypothetical protein